jgi:hypothetical protein
MAMGVMATLYPDMPVTDGTTPDPVVVQCPTVKAEVQGKQFRLKWEAVKGATAYAVALYQNGAWRCKAQVSGSTLTYTSPKGVKSGKYQVAICPKVNGQWVNKSIKSKSITVTIKG